MEMVSYRSMPEFDEYKVNSYLYRYFVFNLMADHYIPELVPLVDEIGEVQLDENGEIVYVESEKIDGEEDSIQERDENLAMQDVRVRQAITHAIDIQTLFTELYFDIGQLNYGGSISLAKEVYEYNPNKAIDLLAEAEYDMNRPFTIGYYQMTPTTSVFINRVKEYLEAIGLTVQLVELNEYEDIYEVREYDMFLNALSAFNTEEWYNEYTSSHSDFHQVIGTTEFDILSEDLSTAGGDISKFVETLRELVILEQELMYKIPLFVLSSSVYINGDRLYVPEDMVFGNIYYRSNLRVDEWYIKQE